MTMNTGPMCDSTGGMPSDDNATQQGAGDMQSADTSMGQSGTNIEQARQQVGNVAQEIKGAASQATTAVSDATRRTATQAKDAASRMVGQATGQAKQLTQQLTQQATEQGANMFNEQKSRAAQSLGGLGAALRCAAGTLRDEQDKNLAVYTDSLADGIESCASYLRDSDARRLMSDAGNLARRRPEWVLGGAFIAGLALVRFLKASRSDTAGSQYDEMGGSSHLDYATSDDYMADEDLVSRYRVGNHPGIGGTQTDAGPDANPQMGGRDFARTDTARTDEGPDVAITTPAVVPEATGTDADVTLNPDSTMNRDNQNNPSTGVTL